MDLCDLKSQFAIEGVGQVPRVAGQFSCHVAQKAGGAEDVKDFFPTQKKTQELIEPAEVVHMGM
jgi:hypothetical protein